jgi:hypothetical protein
MNKSASAVIFGALVFLGIGLGVWMTFPPPIPSALSLKQFSIEHQKQHIKRLAQKPHAIGSAEHRRVRNVIVNALRELEFTPRTQRELCTRSWETGSAQLAWVENILVRVRGSHPSRAVLIMAHYDSKPHAPGANDDGAGAAAILEILRILSVSEPPKNDIIALFTDGEEAGMFGAQAFFERHPWASDVGVVLNLEARGSAGVTYLVETGPENAWLVKAFAASAANPIGNSITHAVYRLMPNYTDFILAKDAGIPGMNFAYMDGWHTYHSPLDDLDHLSDATLYHHGSSALQVLRSLAEMPLDTPPPGDAVYFTLWRPWMVSYPLTWVWPLTALVLLLYAGTLVIGFWKKYLYLRGILVGFVSLIVSGAAAWGLAVLLEKALRMRFGSAYSVIARYPEFRHVFLAAFLGLSFAIFFFVCGWARRRIEMPSLASGALLWWALGTAAAAHFMPQASFLLMWPLLFVLGSLWIVWAYNDPDETNPGQALLVGILALPALIHFSFVFTAFNTAFRLTPLSILIPMLMLSLLIPALTLFRPKFLWKTAAVFLVLTLALTGIGGWIWPLDQRPQPQDIICRIEPDQAYLSVRPLSAWAASFMAEPEEKNLSGPSQVAGQVWQIPMPGINVPPPRIEVASQAGPQEGRRIRLRLISPRRAPVTGLKLASNAPFTLQIEGGEEKLFSFNRTERDVDAGMTHQLQLDIYALPENGMAFILEVEGSGPWEARIFDLSYDLPQAVDLPPTSSDVLLYPYTVVTSRRYAMEVPKP